MAVYVSLQRGCGLSMHEVEAHWDDMQFYAFLDQLIVMSRREKAAAEKEREKAAVRRSLGIGK